VMSFHAVHSSFFWDGKFFITERGYLGLASLVSVAGDVVVLLPGGRVPYVLSHVGNEEVAFAA
jgi:hypothetical protein